MSGRVPGTRRYKCAYCGHVYDEALGEPDDGLPKGTLFEDIPDDWTCPECGAFKFDYHELLD